MKNILVINTSVNNSRPLYHIFEKMKEDKYGLIFWTKAGAEFEEQIRSIGCAIKHINLGIFQGWNNSKNPHKFSTLKFILLLPLYYIKFFFLILFYKITKKIDTIILFSINEKIIITPISTFFHIKPIWLHFPEQSAISGKGLLYKIYKRFSLKTSIVCFLNKTKKDLIDSGLSEKNIFIVLPGIKLPGHERQSNIFDTIARADHEKSGKKFFTLGTILDLDSDQRLECLFQAISDSRRVIPNVQLIVVGDGREKKSLVWLAKKMEIENNVWFIGKQKYTRKWISGFDVYVNIKLRQNLNDISSLIKAMGLELSIIAPRSTGLEDILNDKKNCLMYNINDTEELASNIINLKQNFTLRKNLGERAKENHLNLEFNKMYSDFIGCVEKK